MRIQKHLSKLAFHSRSREKRRSAELESARRPVGLDGWKRSWVRKKPDLSRKENKQAGMSD